jgi:Uncharacterized protein conserved in bacteria
MPHRLPICLYLVAVLVLTSLPCQAWYHLPGEASIIPEGSRGVLMGRNRTYVIRPGETLMEIARSHGLGFTALQRANPEFDAWSPGAGRELLLPFAFLLPSEVEPGITINLAEFRLYHVWREGARRRVRVYPTGIGSEGYDTPQGRFTIVNKIVNPSWTVPPSIRAKNPLLPAVVPPGPNNPLGEYWLGLSIPGYGIHGTNRPFGIGRRISHGCVRLYPADIRDLFGRVSIGTPVRIIHRPIKAAIHDDQLLVEVHTLAGPDPEGLLAEALTRIRETGWTGPLDRDRLDLALRQGLGIPVVVSPPDREP